jgi:hypothetical protein
MIVVKQLTTMNMKKGATSTTMRFQHPSNSLIHQEEVVEIDV